eukprot:2632274-Rhodomonas_salina.2
MRGREKSEENRKDGGTCRGQIGGGRRRDRLQQALSVVLSALIAKLPRINRNRDGRLSGGYGADAAHHISMESDGAES